MNLRLATVPALNLQGKLKLAHLLEMREREFEELTRRLEADRLYQRLMTAEVVSIEPFRQARFASRNFDGLELRASNTGIPDLLDGQGDLAKLIERVGQERFEKFFLKDETAVDTDIAHACGLSALEVRRLKDYIDKLYIRTEFEGPSTAPLPEKVYSAVAGIQMENQKPVLSFFNRNIWKGRYRIDQDRLKELLRDTTPLEARRLEQFLRRMEYLDQRKSTLYRVLESVMEVQAEYFATGDPARRRTLTQSALSSQLGISPSVLNSLISNKSIQLPWGLEAPMKSLFPSRKSLLSGLLYELASKHGDLSDRSLAGKLERLCGARLSRRSIAQYRKETQLLSSGRRSKIRNYRFAAV